MEMAAPAAAPASSQAAESTRWQQAAMALLVIRCMQGFVFWGGGSRRFIYDPEKLDPGAHTWMAMKFQSAMPGALLGTDRLIAFMLEHFWLLYPALIVFSAAELVAGMALLAGLFTRLAAAASMGFAVALMLMFGWQGGTCLDEWTMASCNLAMGAALLLAGGGAWSVDGALLKRNPGWANRPWFRWLGGVLPLPLSEQRFRNFALVVIASTMAFNLGTYSYYRGSVVTPFHSGRVSPTTHHFTLRDAELLPDGAVRFEIYLDGGTADIPAHIMKAEIVAADGRVLSSWDSPALSRVPSEFIRNRFAYNRFVTGPYGLVAGMGAQAVITLPPAAPVDPTSVQGGKLRLTSVDGVAFSANLAARGAGR